MLDALRFQLISLSVATTRLCSLNLKEKHGELALFYKIRKEKWFYFTAEANRIFRSDTSHLRSSVNEALLLLHVYTQLQLIDFFRL